MWLDVADLGAFYRSRLGRVAARILRSRIRALWPDARGLSILGLGYATPVLAPFRDEASLTVAAMPQGQGVIRWPRHGSNNTVLVDEADLPFPDLSVDRVILIHAVENSEQLRPMLREVWRVLKDSGRVLVVVPRRRGLWAQFEHTPFGHGHPFSPRQLSRLMRDCLFTPLGEGGGLFVPPLRFRPVLATAAAWERLGARWFGLGAGVVMMEGGKRFHAPVPTGALTSRLARPVRARTAGGRAAQARSRRIA